MRHPTRDGLAWDDNGLGPVARWTRQPDIEAIERVCRRALNLNHNVDCTVQLHANGEFSKLYAVDSIRGRHIIRISLPVDPGNKTLGEVFTLRLVHRMTDIPVPKVIAWDETINNELGFEWLLMEMMPGKLAYYRWRKMTDPQKEILTKRVAEFHTQLLRCGNLGQGFRSIGTLGTGPNADYNSAVTPSPGPIVDSVFFSGPRCNYPVPRGPFDSSHDWLRAYLDLIIMEHTNALAKAKTEDDKEHAEMVLRLARKLLRMVHKIFPSLVFPPEHTVLWHDDLSLKNLLVDNNGRVTGVIGWECVSTVPRWMACQMPAFLRGPSRKQKPNRDSYTNLAPRPSLPAADEDHLDNEGKTELYWIHLMEYDQTQLREVYQSRMTQLLGPEWEKDVEEARLKVDFLGAVSRCGTQFYPIRVEQWVDAIDRKEFISLMQALRMGIKKEKPSTTPSGTVTPNKVHHERPSSSTTSRVQQEIQRHERLHLAGNSAASVIFRTGSPTKTATMTGGWTPSRPSSVNSHRPTTSWKGSVSGASGSHLETPKSPVSVHVRRRSSDGISLTSLELPNPKSPVNVHIRRNSGSTSVSTTSSVISGTTVASSKLG
ncbi:phosphotransferase enzyme family-domain-containing protein [Apiosordaria backusii]|uniref:Phosphotransferase enzyme family-domain-containing protein n=1 Tax=Apiosordaria backusii TaxID=314023 RepID=A0AA40AAJ7_9PEZI|nr:phosphotransferase enzyme family-domain-containing protein [Apiosordaria backusii]